MAACYNCGAAILAEAPVGRSLECDSCNKPIRCCRNCTFYQPGAHWDCRETIPEAVRDKEAGNFCDYFRLNDRKPGGDLGDPKQKKARSDFDSLFS
jgi:hypothetical protein